MHCQTQELIARDADRASSVWLERQGTKQPVVGLTSQLGRLEGGVSRRGLTHLDGELGSQLWLWAVSSTFRKEGQVTSRVGNVPQSEDHACCRSKIFLCLMLAHF